MLARPTIIPMEELHLNHYFYFPNGNNLKEKCLMLLLVSLAMAVRYGGAEPFSP